MTNIDSDDGGSAALQQYFRETAGRGAEIEADAARRIEREEIEGVDKFQCAAGNVGMFEREKFDLVALADRISRFRRDPASDKDMARADRALRAGARCNEAAFDQRKVEAAPAFRP